MKTPGNIQDVLAVAQVEDDFGGGVRLHRLRELGGLLVQDEDGFPELPDLPEPIFQI